MKDSEVNSVSADLVQHFRERLVSIPVRPLKWLWCVRGVLSVVVMRSGSAEAVKVAAVRSGSVDVVPAGEAQGGGALPALQRVLDHVLPLLV